MKGCFSISPPNVASSVTGLVTPRKVRSPVTLAVRGPVSSTWVDLKVICGKTPPFRKFLLLAMSSFQLLKPVAAWVPT
ncbi:hypothetical protein D3C77_434880 [compost metagenome]